MSRPKGGRSVQLRGTAFESERWRQFGFILKWGVSVVFITKALRWAPRVRTVTPAYSTGDNSKIVTRGTQFTTIKQENVGSKGSESGKSRRHIHVGP